MYDAVSGILDDTTKDIQKVFLSHADPRSRFTKLFPMCMHNKILAHSSKLLPVQLMDSPLINFVNQDTNFIDHVHGGTTLRYFKFKAQFGGFCLS